MPPTAGFHGPVAAISEHIIGQTNGRIMLIVVTSGLVAGAAGAGAAAVGSACHINLPAGSELSFCAATYSHGQPPTVELNTRSPVEKLRDTARHGTARHGTARRGAARHGTGGQHSQWLK